MTPTTLSEAFGLIGLHLRLIADGRAMGIGRETAARLLSLESPDLIDMIAMVSALHLARDAEGALQLLQSISQIAIAGGWQAVVDHPDASRSWASFGVRHEALDPRFC